MNHLNHWEEHIRRGLAHHEVTPPAMGWNKLEQALRTSAAASQHNEEHEIERQAEEKQQGKTIGIPLRRWLRPVVGVGSVAIAAAVAVVAVMNQPSASDDVAGTMAQNPKKGKTSAPSVQPALAKLAVDVAAGVVADVDSVHRKYGEHRLTGPIHSRATLASCATGRTAVEGRVVYGARQTADADDDIMLLAEETEEANEARASVDDKAGAVERQKAPSESETAHREVRSFRAVHPQSRSLAYSSRTPAAATGQSFRGRAALKQHWEGVHMPQISLHMSATSSQTMRQQGAYYGSPTTIPYGSVMLMNKEQEDFAHIVGENLNRRVESNVKHHTPFTTGLNVGIPLTHNWSLRTGVTYTKLTTDIQAGSDVAYYTTQQNLHYVGVPLSAAYTIYDSRFFSVYAATGVQLEKCVKATRSTTYDNTDQRRSSQTTIDGFANGLWQLSAQASVGGQLNLTRHIGLYFEPGVSYFVSDGSSLPNIRHDHPWNFNMQGGLRITLAP